MYTNFKKKCVLTLLCSLMLTGCSGNLSSNDLYFKEQAEKSGLSGTSITVMASNDWIKDSEIDLGSDFEAATGIHIIYDLYSDGEYLDTLMSCFNNNKNPDIFLLQSGLSLDKTYHLDKYAVDLSDEPWMSYYESFSIEQTSINGHNYGMTYYDTTTDYYLVYNKKIFASAGITAVPKTFEEFADACQKISALGITPIYEPMADGWHQTMLFAETGQVFEKLEPGTFDRLNRNEERFADNSNMLLALEQIQKLAQDGYFGPDYRTNTFEHSTGYLASGEYAMCLLKPGSINSIIDSDLNIGYKKKDFGLMLIPICGNQYLNVHPTGPTHFVSASSPNIEAAKLYLSYIASKENIQYMIDESDTVENLPFDAGQTPDYDATTRDFLEQFNDSNSGMVIQDEVMYFNEQWDKISTDILDMCDGKLTASQVLERIDSRREELAHAAGDVYWTAN